MTSSAPRPDDLCLVGFGARTPVGETAPAAAAAVRAAVSAFAEHPHMIDRYGEPMIVARDGSLPDEPEGVSRLAALMAAALSEAAGALEGRVRPEERPPLFLGLPPDRPGRPSDIARISALLAEGFRTPCSLGEVALFETGHAAGVQALDEAARRLAQGKVEWCFVGGVDSYLEPLTLEWLDEREQLRSEAHLWGFVPGEGAAALAVSFRRTAERRGWKILATVSGMGTAKEESLIHTDAVCLGRGLTEAIRKAAGERPEPRARIDQTYCDLNGQPYRSDEFGYTVTRISPWFIDASEFTAPADCWGDVGAATVPLLLSLALVSGVKAYAKGPRVLVWTSSDGGQRGAAALRLELPKEA